MSQVSRTHECWRKRSEGCNTPFKPQIIAQANIGYLCVCIYIDFCLTEVDLNWSLISNEVTLLFRSNTLKYNQFFSEGEYAYTCSSSIIEFSLSWEQALLHIHLNLSRQIYFHAKLNPKMQSCIYIKVQRHCLTRLSWRKCSQF